MTRATRFSPPRFRPSFTLVELLVAIAIMGVLVGMVLFSLAGAATDAKIGRTRATIDKINSVILERWEEYRYRAVSLNIPSELLRPTGGNGQPLLLPRESARLRMVILRDMMRMEMPDRLTDILYPPTQYKVALADGQVGYLHQLRDVRSQPVNYDGRHIPGRYEILRQYFNYSRISLTGNYTNAAVPRLSTAAPNAYLPPPPDFVNQSAECLYAIVANSQHSGGNALEAFRPTEIGDTDGDGYLEFIDAWGNPIRWIRWPAGFESALNNGYQQPSSDNPGIPVAPDAMDPIRTDWRWLNGAGTYVSSQSETKQDTKPWTLVPLVISAGPDGVFDIAFDPEDNSLQPLFLYPLAQWTGVPPYGPGYFNVDPFAFRLVSNIDQSIPQKYFDPPYPQGRVWRLYVGSTVDEDGDGGFGQASDNISNHNLILQ